MPNPVQIPEDLIVPGDLRLGGAFSPPLARSALLAQGVLQAFTIPMNVWREPGDIAMTPGTGISVGTNTICLGRVSRVGVGLIKTEIYIDLTGLNGGGTAGDIIGKTATANCHIGQITTALNGTIVHGRLTCIETPATSDDDVDFYGTVTEATGTQDVAISGLTGEVILLNNGNWSGAEATPIALTTLPGEGYLYMVTGTTEGTATYTAGKFLLELWGTPASLDYVGGAYGTNAPSLQTPDFGGNSAAVSYYARAEIPLPWEYEAGQSVTLRVAAGMITTVADQTATVDVEAYESDEDSTSTGDICATTAISDNMNSLVFADVDFVITPTNLSAGDLLDVRLTVTVDDDGDSGVMKGCIGSVQLLCDVR